jgi:LacI family transcriptional regulator
VPSISPDEHQVGLDATALLLQAGHRRIAHLTVEDPEGLGVQGRIAGYRRAMSDAGLSPLVVPVPGPAEASAGRLALSEALQLDPDLTAVFVFNDPMAMGVYQTASQRGLRVPEDLSVVSVDNLELIAGQLLPGLTTFELPHYEMGRWAVGEAVKRLDDRSAAAEAVSVRCPIVVRRSVASRV